MGLLETKGVSINFGGLWAVKAVDFSIEPRQIVGLIGPNGSGKTTFLNVISGIYRATEGSVWLKGADVTGLRPFEIFQRGVSRTYQTSRLCWDLSVADNLLTGFFARRKSGILDAVFRPRAADRETYALLEDGLSMLATFNPALVGRRYELLRNIPHIDRRRIEISRALVGRPSVLLLDEPTAGLNDEETMQIVEDNRKIKARRQEDRGGRLPGHRVRPGRRGRVLGGGCGMSGGGGGASGGGVGGGGGNVLEVAGLDTSYGRIPMLRGVTLAVPRGEVCCVLGANGAGKTTLVKAVLNMVRADRGSMALDGAPIDGWPTHRRVMAGIALSAAAAGTFHKMTVEANLRMGAYYIKDRALLEERLEEAYRSFPVLRERLRQKAGTLSGGERTMLSIARAVINKPKLLILDEPSLGLAPIMVEEVFGIIQRLREQRMSILLGEQNAAKALAVAGSGYVIQKGAIVFSGTAEALRASEFMENPVM
jgi:ABC-type branched-subunit amino acid transport system ATPase component